MAALLTSVGDDKDKMGVYLADARRMGVRVLSPDVNESAVEFTAVGDDVRFGLTAVRNVGVPVAEAVIRGRKARGAYTSFADFLAKVEAVACQKRAVDSLVRAGAFDSLGHSRKALSAVHEQAVDAVVGVKRREEHGQFDLFGDAPDTGRAAVGPGFGLDFDLGGEEWPRRQLLSVEREMLGLYVSGHPLDGAEHLLARHRDMTVANLLASGRSEGFVQLAGLVTAVDRRVNKAGSPWAVLTLTDHDASVEVLFFPKNHALYAPEFIEDNAVAVRGRINERDGTVSIVGDTLIPLDLTAVAHGGRPPVVLALHERRITPELVARLKAVLLGHPGDTEVRLRMTGRGGGTTLMRLGPTVDNTTAFASEVKALLGADAWRT
jgi:DNA polymerase-3 subunit alpha